MYHQVSTVYPPYWGLPDSNMDWCESNYDFTPYVAELLNALSSVPMFFMGVYGIYYHYKHAHGETKFTMTFASLAIVGLGSVAFHATLRYWGQALDEYPMLLGGMVMFYNTLTFDKEWGSLGSNGKESKEQRQHPITTLTDAVTLRWSMLALTVIISIIYFGIPELYVIFIVMYGGSVLLNVAVMVYYMYYLPCRARKGAEKANYIGPDPESFDKLNEGRSLQDLIADGYIPRFSAFTMNLYIKALCSYGLGFALWVTENALCRSLPPWLYLHACWHILAGLGTYWGIQTQIAFRAEYHLRTAALINPEASLLYIMVDKMERRTK